MTLFHLSVPTFLPITHILSTAPSLGVLFSPLISKLASSESLLFFSATGRR